MGRSGPRLNFPYTGARRTAPSTIALSCQRSDRSSTVPTGGVWSRCWLIRSARAVWPESAPVTEASSPSQSLKSQPARRSRVPVRVSVSKTLMPTVTARENRPPTGYSLGWTGGSGLARARAGARRAASPARASTRVRDTWPAKLARALPGANGRSARGRVGTPDGRHWTAGQCPRPDVHGSSGRLLLGGGGPVGGLDRGAHEHDAVTVTGDRALDEDEVLLGVHVHHGEVLGGHLLHAVVPGHLLVGVHAAARLPLADGARVTPVLVGAVGLTEPPEIPALHHALEAAALGDARDVDQLALLEQADADRIAHVEAGGLGGADPELLQHAPGLDAGLLEGALLRAGQTLLLRLAKPERHRRVLVALGGALAHDRAGGGVDDRD